MKSMVLYHRKTGARGESGIRGLLLNKNRKKSSELLNWSFPSPFKVVLICWCFYYCESLSLPNNPRLPPIPAGPFSLRNESSLNTAGKFSRHTASIHQELLATCLLANAHQQIPSSPVVMSKEREPSCH